MLGIKVVNTTNMTEEYSQHHETKINRLHFKNSTQIACLLTESNKLAILNVSNGDITTEKTLPGTPISLKFNSDSSRLSVIHQGGNRLSLYNSTDYSQITGGPTISINPIDCDMHGNQIFISYSTRPGSTIISNAGTTWDILLPSTYDVGDVVKIYGTANSIHEALSQNSEYPPISDNWLRIKSVNELAMFSDQISDKTKNISSITFKIDIADQVTSIAFFGVVGNSIQITGQKNGDVFYNKTKKLVDNGLINDWWEYYYGPISSLEEYIVTDIPPTRDGTYTISIINSGNVAECGLIVFGRTTNIGVSNFGTSVSIMDYSRKERDEFGRPIIVERNFTKQVSYDVTCETSSVGSVQRILASVRAIPCVWIGDEKRSETVVFGYYNDFNIVISSPSLSDCSIDVEGLT